MAIYATACVACKDATRKETVRYYSRDNKGKYSVCFYECENSHCSVQYGKLRKKIREYPGSRRVDYNAR